MSGHEAQQPIAAGNAHLMHAMMATQSKSWGQSAPHVPPADAGLGRGRAVEAEEASVHLQIENEFGFVGPNEPYLRHLHTLARDNLGDDVQLFSTDPPAVIDKGSLGGDWSFA